MRRRIRKLQTPTTQAGLKCYDHLPAAEAARKAWVEQGHNPRHHWKARRAVRTTMPVLARALDRLQFEQLRYASEEEDETA